MSQKYLIGIMESLLEGQRKQAQQITDLQNQLLQQHQTTEQRLLNLESRVNSFPQQARREVRREFDRQRAYARRLVQSVAVSRGISRADAYVDAYERFATVHGFNPYLEAAPGKSGLDVLAEKDRIGDFIKVLHACN